MTAGNFKDIAQWVPGRSGRLVQEEKSLLVDVVVWVAVVALWSLLWRVAGVAGAGPYTSLWYPPAALTLSLLIAGGWRALPLALAGPLVNITVQGLLGSAYVAQTHSLLDMVWEYGGPPVAHLIGYALAAYGIQRTSVADPDGRARGELSPATAIRFVGFSLAASALSAAAGAALSVRRTGNPWDTWGSLFLHWWGGDFIGVVTLTPVLLLAFSMLPYAPLHAKAHPFENNPHKHSQFGSRYWLSLACTFGSVAFLLWLKEIYKIPIPYSLPFLTGLIGMGFIALDNELAAVSVMIALMGLLGAMGVAFMGNFELVMELNFFIPACTLASLLSHSMCHLVAHNSVLSSETLHDPLTGVCNRKGLAFHFSAHLRDIQGGRRRLCLASMDIDHFKRVNDTLGHAVGDEVLKRVTRLLADHTTAADCIARIGGDEIVILLPGFSLDDCVKRIEAMRRGIEAISDLPISLTASFGVIQVEPHNSQEVALARADNLLYQAKARGRNRVERDSVPV